MTLGELIWRLQQERNPNRVCARGFGKPHSYRGTYKHLAFSPAENVTVGEMLQSAQFANGAVFCGWKGGQFLMTLDSFCYLAEEGECGEGDEMENWIEVILS